MAVYLNDWAEGGEAEMLSDFGIDRTALANAEVIVASYTYEDYEGYAYVLFRRNGKLYEVHGGHCSCYGLSECDYLGSSTTQWQPEEADKAAILHRIEKGTWGADGGVADIVRAALS